MHRDSEPWLEKRRMTEDPTFPLFAGLAAFAALTVILPLFFMGICRLIAGAGWSALARVYSAPPSPLSKPKARLTGGQIGNARYNGCLWCSSNEKGLNLSVLFFFRAGHAPLFIPWSDATLKTVTHRRWGQSTEIRLKQSDVVIVLMGLWEPPVT